MVRNCRTMKSKGLPFRDGGHKEERVWRNSRFIEAEKLDAIRGKVSSVGIQRNTGGVCRTQFLLFFNYKIEMFIVNVIKDKSKNS